MEFGITLVFMLCLVIENAYVQMTGMTAFGSRYRQQTRLLRFHFVNKLPANAADNAQTDD